METLVFHLLLLRADMWILGPRAGSEDTAGQEPRGLCGWLLPPRDPECEGSGRGSRFHSHCNSRYSQGVPPHRDLMRPPQAHATRCLRPRRFLVREPGLTPPAKLGCEELLQDRSRDGASSVTDHCCCLRGASSWSSSHATKWGTVTPPSPIAFTVLGGMPRFQRTLHTHVLNELLIERSIIQFKSQLNLPRA